MVPAITWRQALGWRMERQLLDPLGSLPVEDVVRRLGGVQAQVASSAELAVRVRSQSGQGEVGRALEDGRLIKTWAMRGTLHLLAPEDAGAILSLLAAGRLWERPSWMRYFGMSLERWVQLRSAAWAALEGGPLTREELAAAIAGQGLAHLGEELLSGWGTLLKPLAWQGDLCYGPSRDGRVTFTRPGRASSRWTGVLPPDEAAPIVIGIYLRAYGPATMANLGNWLARGAIKKRQLQTWFEAMRADLAEISVDGDAAYVLAADLDEVLAAHPSSAVRLLPGFDQYVLGPGTDDAHVVPAARRRAVSKQSGWIAPAVVADGVVSGTWQLVGDEARIAWFAEAGKSRTQEIQAEVVRLGAILGRELRPVVELA